MSAFHDVRFPVSVSFKSSGGPMRRTEIVELQSGAEERNTPWAHGRRRYDAGTGIRSLSELEAVLSFFEARRGALHAFRWKDFADFRSCVSNADISPLDQMLGTGDAATTSFQLVKTCESGAYAYVRPITKPVSGTVRVAVDGVEVDASDWSVDHMSGIITFDAPPDAGEGITAGFEFDVPARFDTHEMALSLEGFEAGQMPSIQVVEVRDA